jgi:L-malate glycosyltransferase
VKPRVFYVIDNLMLSGAQMHLFNLVNGLRLIGYSDLEIINMSGKGEICAWINKSGIPVHNFSMTNAKSVVFYASFIKLIWFLFRRKPDIVHTYLDTANCFGVVAAKLAGIKKIITSRRDLGGFHTKRMEFLIHNVSNHVDKVVCVCEAAALHSMIKESLTRNNLVVIPNGIDISKFHREINHDRDRIVYTHVAMATRKEKGHEDLLRAFRIVAEAKPNALLKIVGDGPLLPNLKMLASKLGIADKVYFVDKTNDVPAALQDASVFVLPSHSEGISNALLEAMAMGIPAIVTNVGGNPEVVVDNISGIIVEPRSPELLASAMLTIIADKKKLEEMGKEATKRIKSQFLFETMVHKYNELYVNLTNPAFTR